MQMNTAHTPLSFTISQGSLEFMSISWWSYPTISSSATPFFLLPSIFPSIRVFSNELALHIRWPKFWSFSISPSNEYSKLISFGIDCFDLLAVQGTFTTRHIHNRVSFLFWPAATFFLELLVIALHSSPVAYWTPSNLVCSSSGVISFYTIRGVSEARILEWFAIPSSNGPRFVRTLHYDPSVLGGPT